MNVKSKITNIEEFEEYRNQYIIVNPHTLFTQYLTALYPNLVLRNDNLDPKENASNKSDISSYNVINNRNLRDKNITKNTFIQYMGIQDLISERIFKYIDKNSKGKLSKNEFVLGIYQLFYGNFNELAKLSFFICDFNEDGKIYKSDMKLILAYIPKPLNSNMSNYCQQDYIKKINNIIEEFFKEIRGKKQEDIIEINYELYFNKLNQSVEEKKMNGAFFFFINLLKYIFLNKPFNKESILSIKFAKDKYLLKPPFLRGLTTVIKNFVPLIMQTAKKSDSDDLLERNEKENNDFIPIGILKKNYDKKFTEYKLGNKNFNLEKFQRSNLFSNKKLTSTIEQYQAQKALEVKKHESSIIKNDIAVKLNNSNNNVRYHFEKLEQKKKIYNRNASIGRLSSSKIISMRNSTKIPQKSSGDFFFRERIHRNSVRIPESVINKSQVESKNTILPYLSSNSSSFINLKHKFSNKKTDIKIKPFLKLKGKLSSQNDIFENSNGILKNKEDKLSELIDDIVISNNTPTNSELEYGAYLYKYSEEENDMFKKYFAVISQKEILFYSSNLKNELCSIWYINDTVISIVSKTAINKCVYYPIKIIFKNDLMNLLFFDDKETQIEFGNNLKICINNINFEDKYEIKEEIGEGHFAVVKKCINKNNNKEYAVKIIDKQKMEKKDIVLINQEKNYKKIIKHKNIVYLIENIEKEK